MRALRLGVISTAVSLAVCAGWGAATAQELLAVQGALTTGDAVLEDGSLYDEYTFAGSSGQQITISLISQDFDPYLILLDPQGRRIGENDDVSRNNRNSRLVITLPSTGTYTAVANSYESGKTGQYEIKIEAGESPVATLQAMVSEAVPGSSPPCDAALISAIGDIETDREVNAVVSPVQLRDRYAEFPTDRPNGVRVALNGPATLSVIRSPQLLDQLSGELIRNCPTVGAVVFRSAETGFEKIFGFLPDRDETNLVVEADAVPVGEFDCVPVSGDRRTGRSAARSLAWGDQICAVDNPRSGTGGANRS
ncbi:hypothetical protein BH23CYA1_BH23CYA1_16430 [soil metagenome]